MRHKVLILLAALTISSPCLSILAFAAPARFWVSPSATNPYWSGASESDILQIDLYDDPGQDASVAQLYIWAQPATLGPETFKQLQNLTLDIVSTEGHIDFLDDEGGAVIENPGSRFASIRDSTQEYPSNPNLKLITQDAGAITPSNPDKIIGLQGLNLTVAVPNLINEGIGSNCIVGECVVMPQGPIWRIGSFGLQSLGQLGSDNIHLQIGSSGINHLSVDGQLIEPTSLTQVVFSATREGPVYDAGEIAHRQETLGNENPDVRVHVSDKLVGDYDEDTAVSGSDYLRWQSALNNAPLPNRRFGEPGQAELADYQVWETSYGKSITDSLVGDYDEDTDVSGSDYLLWQREFEESELPNRSSIVSGDVGLSDFLAWQLNYGKSVPNGSAALIVPEPESFALVSSAIILGFFYGSFGRFNGLGMRCKRVITKSADTTVHRSRRAGRALLFTLAMVPSLQARGAITVDPGMTGSNNVVIFFVDGGFEYLSNPVPHSLALSDPLAIGHNVNTTGTLLVNAGSSITSTTPGDLYTLGSGIVIGDDQGGAGSMGILTVHDANSRVTTNKNLAVGGIGSGEFNVWLGARATSEVGWVAYGPNSTGLARIWDPGSVWESKELAVGVEGQGTIDIAGGGRVGYTSHEPGSTSYIGFAGTGIATVNGSGSTFYGGELFRVGQGGNGTLNIENGGTVIHNFNSGFDDYIPADGLVLGNNGGSTGTINVTGSNSTLTANKNLTVGRFGSGELNVQSGGRATSNVSWLGYASSSTGTATVTGNGSRWEPDELAIGVAGTGTLDVTSGGRVGYTSHVGGSTSYIGFASAGTATVNGSNSTFYGGEIFRVGQGGIGTLDIENGGTVIHNFNSGLHEDFPENGLVLGNNLGSSGTINVTGTNSSLTSNKNLSIGRFGSGTLNVQSGGSVVSNLSWLGYQASATGTATVNGTGSSWMPKELVVGFLGEGTLDVTNGGRVGATSHVGGSTIFIGHAATGTARVSGSGSTFYGGETFVVGQQSGNGILNIENGGAVVHNFNPNGPDNDEYLFGTGIVIGNGAGATGTINVNGLNSTLTSNKNLAVGGHGSGTLNVEDGGTVNSRVSWLGYHPGSTGTATVKDPGSTWKPRELSVGFEGIGTLDIENGGQVGFDTSVTSSTSYIGFGEGSTGEVTVNGTGSTFYGGRQFKIGLLSGSGTLNIENGGTVVHKHHPARDEYNPTHGLALGNDADSTGTVNVIGTNSSLTADKNLSVGRFGTGTLSIEAGGYVDSNVSWLGYEPNSTGNTLVTDGGSLWDPHELSVGHNGSGTLHIGNGGQVGNAASVIGSRSWIGYAAASAGEVTVDGAGSTFYGGRTFSVGQDGTGTLNVKNGGTVSHSFNPNFSDSPDVGLVLGNNSGSSGTLNVMDSNSSVTAARTFTVGRLGNGTLNVEAGGYVDSGVSWIGYGSDSSGTVTVAGPGSRWNSTELYIGGSESSAGGTGLLTVNNGGVVAVSGGLTIWPSGTLAGNGTVDGNVTGPGRVAPGNSPGILTIDGNYTQSADSTLEIEVASYSGTVGMPDWVAGTDHDQLQVTGTATLGGRLEVPVIDPLKSAGGPATGLPAIEFLTAGTVTGEFDAIVAPGLDAINPNLAIEVDYSAGAVSLSFVPKKLDIEFDDIGNDGSPEWQELPSWRNTMGGASEVPQSVHDLNVVNNVAGAQELVVEDSNAQVARLTVGGGASPLMLTVGDGAADATTEVLSSLTSVAITTNGGLRLHDGELAATSADLTGGIIEGHGVINLAGNLGGQSGTLTVTDGSLSPGTSTPGMEVGTLTIEGEYTQGANGVFSIDITGNNSGGDHDSVDISGSADLDGTLTIDASTFAGLTNGQMYEILSAEVSITGEFDDVVITGAGDKYFKVIYEDGTVSPLSENGELAASSTGGPSRVIVVPYDRGDASGDGFVDNIDAQAFASALLGPGNEFDFGDGQEATWPDLKNAFDFSSDKRIDLDDIAGFANLFSTVNGVSVATAYQTLDAAFAQVEASRVPEPGCLLYCITGLLALGIHRPDRRLC